MLPEWELWACADTVMRHQGDRAPTFVAERIGMFALQGDSEGVATWKAIAQRVQELTGNAARPQ